MAVPLTYFLFICYCNALIEMVRYLFGIPGVKFVLSECFSQDPLEKYFGNQRQRGGTNENPNVQQMVHNASALRALKSVTLNSVETVAGVIKDPPLQLMIVLF